MIREIVLKIRRFLLKEVPYIMQCLLIITVFKECFFFIAKRGYTTDERELGKIMMSLAFSPTSEEVHEYFQKYVKGL